MISMSGNSTSEIRLALSSTQPFFSFFHSDASDANKLPSRLGTYYSSRALHRSVRRSPFHHQVNQAYLKNLVKLQVSSINRVLRNLASSKEQSSHHLSAAAADSVYDKLRMFNGQAAAAAGWAWYGKQNVGSFY